MSKMKVNRIENTATTAGGLDIDSSGNVGIGTSSPSTDLHIVGTSNVLTKTSNGNAAILIGVDSSNQGLINLETNHDLKINTNNTERLRIQSGGGISFNGDTATANALNDYEEGTFTPSFINYGSPSISAAEGEYVKIGGSVFLSMRMSWSGGSTNSTARISGLPFAMIDSHIKVNGWAQKNSEGSSVYRLATTGVSTTALFYQPIRDETSGVFYATVQITSLS